MLDLRAIGVVGAGAALGGILRYLLVVFAVARGGAGVSPLATFLINVTGSFLIGIVIEASAARPEMSPLVRLFLATGVLGGYTTFSTFSFETLALASSGRWMIAVAYSLGSVMLGLVLAYAGIALARSILR